MKATFGLVPCTGNLGMEYSLDHVGPLTRTVADNALLLEVIAGPDGLDSRQAHCKVDRYTGDLGTGAKGLRIGVLDETVCRNRIRVPMPRCVKPWPPSLDLARK